MVLSYYEFPGPRGPRRKKVAPGACKIVRGVGKFTVLLGRLNSFAYFDVPGGNVIRSGLVFLGVITTKLEHYAVASYVDFDAKLCEISRISRR